jgi:hypothetical protein
MLQSPSVCRSIPSRHRDENDDSLCTDTLARRLGHTRATTATAIAIPTPTTTNSTVSSPRDPWRPADRTPLTAAGARRFARGSWDSSPSKRGRCGTAGNSVALSADIPPRDVQGIGATSRVKPQPRRPRRRAPPRLPGQECARTAVRPTAEALHCQPLRKNPGTTSPRMEITSLLPRRTSRFPADDVAKLPAKPPSLPHGSPFEVARWQYEWPISDPEGSTDYRHDQQRSEEPGDNTDRDPVVPAHLNIVPCPADASTVNEAAEDATGVPPTAAGQVPSSGVRVSASSSPELYAAAAIAITSSGSSTGSARAFAIDSGSCSGGPGHSQRGRRRRDGRSRRGRGRCRRRRCCGGFPC